MVCFSTAISPFVMPVGVTGVGTLGVTSAGGWGTIDSLSGGVL